MPWCMLCRHPDSVFPRAFMPCVGTGPKSWVPTLSSWYMFGCDVIDTHNSRQTQGRGERERTREKEMRWN